MPNPQHSTLDHRPSPKAITIQQPWAWAIAAGCKRVENRSWVTHYRGPLWIHAGKSTKWLHAVSDLRDAGFDVPDELVFGAIVAVCELVDVVPYDQGDLFADLGADWFASGPQCWILTRIKPLPEPVECNGAQGLWQPTAEIVERVECQLV